MVFVIFFALVHTYFCPLSPLLRLSQTVCSLPYHLALYKWLMLSEYSQSSTGLNSFHDVSYLILITSSWSRYHCYLIFSGSGAWNCPLWQSGANRSTFDSSPFLWGPSRGEKFSMLIFALMSLLWGLHTIYEVVQSASEESENMKKDYVLSKSFDSD